MWLGVWRRRDGQTEWEEFKKRYWEFREEDCQDLCAMHHAEVHKLYDEIIAQDVAAVGRPLSKYSWEQANRLMDKLEAAFVEWFAKETPGIDDKKYGKYKNLRRRILRNKFRRD